ncbi:hypothetical protein [Pseudomonas plecoglossicida]|uniref:hypothetical protein n=1 Tax=Pseudomonas plecoglossicida TaxID=70775 RepID=UPI0012DDFF75|nr:hypothetical protein [Pseudomonas plecoglossicida]GLR38716.1 hypothetical protein GCM10011247_41150 [Pseudomonas plecoglossicida]
MSKKLSSTSIKGTPPAWSDAEYQRRLGIELHAYKHTAASRERVTAALEQPWLNDVIAKAQAGYVVCDRYPVVHEQLSHTVYMIKPESVQAADIGLIKERVKKEYIEHLQSELNRYKAALAQQLMEAAEAKERQRREAAAAKRLADAEKEANDCFGDLVIPDGIPDAA